MGRPIKKLTIEGFKSIRKLEDFEPRALTVLIGANGAGKSNFVGFFRLLKERVEQHPQLTLATVEGGADACLFMGPKVTPRFIAKLYFGRNGYEFALIPTIDNRLVFSAETTLLTLKRLQRVYAPPMRMIARRLSRTSAVRLKVEENQLVRVNV